MTTAGNTGYLQGDDGPRWAALRRLRPLSCGREGGHLMNENRARRQARQVAALLKDGRPEGCTCPPHPGLNALPSDNRHIGSNRCPYTAIEKASRHG